MSSKLSPLGAGHDPAGNEDPADRLQHLWRQGMRPEVDAFLAQAGVLAPAQVAALLR